ncbi:MAG: YbjN domain-containing protein [Actinomycetota bacterium]|nr:YbjN domain-containing protein [Actinomycetota bacterium]
MADTVGAGGLTPAALAAALETLGVPFVREGDAAFLVTLPGVRRHRTLVWLLVGTHDLLVESFVCRKPDENIEAVYRYLLQRNAGLRTVAYALDAVGDIHLVGRLGNAAIAADQVTAEIDTLLGTVLTASDADFNPILERGFADAIRREWAWRTSRGESVRNLEAFQHLIGS